MKDNNESSSKPETLSTSPPKVTPSAQLDAMMLVPKADSARPERSCCLDARFIAPLPCLKVGATLMPTDPARHTLTPVTAIPAPVTKAASPTADIAAAACPSGPSFSRHQPLSQIRREVRCQAARVLRTRSRVQTDHGSEPAYEADHTTHRKALGSESRRTRRLCAVRCARGVAVGHEPPNARLVGVDYYSVEQFHSGHHRTHRTLLAW